MFKYLVRAFLRVLRVSHRVSVGSWHPAASRAPMISERFAIYDANAGRWRQCVSLDATQPTDLVRISSEIRW